MVLNKRILRDFKQNAVRNIAMILIISLSMAMVVALCSTTECISYVIHSEWEKTNVEDGSFETYIPLSKRNMSDLSELDVVIEKMFYTDIYVNSVSQLRFFTDRKYSTVSVSACSFIMASWGSGIILKSGGSERTSKLSDMIFLQKESTVQISAFGRRTACSLKCLFRTGEMS